MHRLLEIARRARLPAALALVALFAVLAGRPDAALAQPNPCRLLTGPAKSACTKDEVAKRTQFNIQYKNANNPPAPAVAPAPRGFPTPGGQLAPSAFPSSGRAGAYVSPAARQATAPSTLHLGPPVIDRRVPASMSLVYSLSSNTLASAERLMVTRTCGSSSLAGMPFDRGCAIERGATSASTALFKQGCEEGDPSGCFMYADHIAAANPAAAHALYVRACDDAQHWACYRVAAAYESGTGVAKNPAQARAYYDLACKAGNDFGCRFLEGKVEARCPHGTVRYDINATTDVNTVVCDVFTGLMTGESFELRPTAADLAAMKPLTARAHQTNTLVRILEPSAASRRDAACRSMESRDNNGNPIAGSGCPN